MSSVDGVRTGRRGRPVWMERPKIITQVVKTVALGVSVLLVLVPFWSILATSIASQEAINDAGGGMVLWPRGVSLEAYRAVVSGGVVTRGLLISIGVTVVGTVLSVAATTGLAYWLSKVGSFLAKPVLILVLGSILFTPGLIPIYLVVKQAGLLDSWWSLILPVLINGFNVLVMRSFFQELPNEVLEAAAIDGAGTLRILVSVVLPLSKAIIAVMTLFYAVAYWNAFFNALLFINDAEKWPMALILRTYVVNQTQMGADQLGPGMEAMPPQLSIQMAVLCLAILPILTVYPFVQKHFSKGVMIGAVKG